jgi:phosphinothricin acetyltransferase
MNIQIRPATTADLPAILEMVNHSILTSTANYHYDPETLEQREAWFSDHQKKEMPVVVAVYAGNTIGFGAYGQFREKIGYRFTVEHSVYVAEGFHGRGVGSQLLAKLIESAKAQGIHSMIAGIDADNTGSIEFHRKFGFETVAHFREIGFKFGRWLDVVFMQLFLDPKDEQQEIR